MTIVIAKRIGERISVMSDTYISDENGIKDKVIPGRLKSVVVNKWLTISYAGLSDQAIDAIRAIHSMHDITTQGVVNYLFDVACQYESQLDFILFSHEHDVRLVKILSSGIYEGSDHYWIGNIEAANAILTLFKDNLEKDLNFINFPDQNFIVESKFRSAFSKYMRESGCEGVGGVVMDCLSSPYGHCYQTYSSSFSWDVIDLGSVDYSSLQEEHKSGMYHYSYNVVSLDCRGEGIVGFYLDQAQIGFIYDPIRLDEALAVRKNCLNLESFTNFFNDYAYISMYDQV